MRVCLVSHRLGGFDGVSVEAAKWVAGFRALGWPVTRAAGIFLDHETDDVVVDGLWAAKPGEKPPPVDHGTIRQLCHGHDLLVLDNAGSLWSAPEASAAWQRHALDAGIPTIVRHHDPAWQGAALRPVPTATVPLHHLRHLHVLINRHTFNEFACRWPALTDADALRVVHNRIDVDGLAEGNRDRTRGMLNIGSGDLIVLHPARVEAANKNIPGAVRFARVLRDVVQRPVRYWLTDDTVADRGSVAKALAEAPGLLRGHLPSQADMYAAADVVVLPSTWEGWGLPVVEAAAAGRLVVAGPYPVLAEIRAFGVTVLDPGEVTKVAALLNNPASACPLLERNRRAVSTHFDLRELPAVLRDLATDAQQLASRTPVTSDKYSST